MNRNEKCGRRGIVNMFGQTVQTFASRLSAQNEYDCSPLGTFGSQAYGVQRALWAVDDDSGSRVTTVAEVENITTKRKEELLELRHCVSVVE